MGAEVGKVGTVAELRMFEEDPEGAIAGTGLDERCEVAAGSRNSRVFSNATRK